MRPQTGVPRYVTAVAQSDVADGWRDHRVDGVTARERGLPGKPAPDTFLAAAADLGVDRSAAVVFEDALAGVQAGLAAHTALAALGLSAVIASAPTDLSADSAPRKYGNRNPEPENDAPRTCHISLLPCYV